MASLKEVRTRITSVNSTRQITSAMKMVAAAKFRKAQEKVLQARPFSREMQATLGRLATYQEVADHPLMKPRDSYDREDLFVLTSDRGLCGSFNSNVIRAVEHYLLDHHERRDKIQLSTIGAKAFRYFKKDRAGVKQNVEDFLDKPLYSQAVELAEELTDRFLNNEIDKVTLVFNEFK